MNETSRHWTYPITILLMKILYIKHTRDLIHNAIYILDMVSIFIVSHLWNLTIPQQVYITYITTAPNTFLPRRDHPQHNIKKMIKCDKQDIVCAFYFQLGFATDLDVLFFSVFPPNLNIVRRVNATEFHIIAEITL